MECKTLADEAHSGANSASFTSPLHCVVDIVAAYVGHNSLRAGRSSGLDQLGAFRNHRHLAAPASAPATARAAEPPAVAIKKSVTNDHIICLEDGKKFKSLRRHLSSFHGLTPDAYRAKWNLGSDYPMVAPAYSATRSQLARDSGLGQVARPAPAADTAKNADAPTPKKAGRGRPKKVVPLGA